MAGAINQKYQQTKTRVQEQLTNTREGIVQKKDEIVDRGRRFRSDLEKRRDLAVGKLRDGSLERLYEVGETASRKVANLLDNVNRLAPGNINLLAARANALESRAQRFEQARDGLAKPQIDDYDELNVNQVKEALAGLTAYELNKVEAYEAANKNRVTVLREVERLLSN